MNTFRKLLYPFSVLYDGVTQSRNVLYDKGIITSKTFEVPLIVVGNLRVGGTGKTPMVVYLINLVKSKYKIAVLSRGYKRSSSGFVLANSLSDANILGDEPFQIYRQFPDILVAVDADRAHGIQNLMDLPEPPHVIILDDAYQHRSIKAEFNILLTAYDDLYVDDAVMPTGNLRENVSGADRAQVIVVTKSPNVLTEHQEFEVIKKLKPAMTQTVFFSTILYNDKILGKDNAILISQLQEYQILLITGIANPKPLVTFLKSENINFEHLEFPDHYQFKNIDMEHIKSKYNSLNTNKKIILTTEKDYVRIFTAFDDLYYLPIQTQIVNHQKDFNQMILNYVEQRTRNRSIS